LHERASMLRYTYWSRTFLVESSWNVMAHSDAREGKWRGNWRMEWVASTLHTTSEHSVSSITIADVHTSAASSDWTDVPRRFKWTRPFRRKTKSGFYACAITFQTQSTSVKQVKRLLALRCRRLEAVRHKTHCKRPFKKSLVKGWKVIAPEIFKSDVLWAVDKGNYSLFS
jgi:hypothetical protein